MDREEALENFEYFDSDNNGVIDFTEFCSLMDALGSESDDKERKLGFSIIDADRNGSIEFDEFFAWFSDETI